jgi:hypothetical protein
LLPDADQLLKELRRIGDDSLRCRLVPTKWLAQRQFAAILRQASRIKARSLIDVPRGTCDSHVHVVKDSSHFPMPPDRDYRPPPATADQLERPCNQKHGKLGFLAKQVCYSQTAAP